MPRTGFCCAGYRATARIRAACLKKLSLKTPIAYAPAMQKNRPRALWITSTLSIIANHPMLVRTLYRATPPLSKPIPTNVDGIVIGELLPMLAKQADKYSIIRSLTHGINAHETASYMTQTGRRPGDRLVYPSAGAVVSLFKGNAAGYRGQVPAYIVLTQPQGRFSEAGFLGQRYKPFATGGDPAQTRFAVEGIVAPGISDQRQQARRELREPPAPLPPPPPRCYFFACR
jgi:hypothetical protein